MDAERTLDLDPGDRVAPPKPFAAGYTIGHFRIIRELGAGGMGIVFEAYDPDLDRRVAIKVVRGRDASTEAGARLIREAQAMAKLAHPNVVAVHEVGTIEGEVFLVMELVPGETLAVWLETPRPWREIVGAFVQAGEGLAAAHAAGLIHRDFKPANVLVDRAGRVRVGDFGLAREDDIQLAKGSERLMAGTPGYMAPEQRVGDPVDARADQYAFSVSLQQALRKAGKVPRRVRIALQRGLQMDPDDRYPHMEDLLAQLRRTLDKRRRWVAAVAATALLSGGGAAAAVLLATPGTDDCGATLVDQVWKHQLPFAGPAAATTSKLVDDWAAAWKLSRVAACKSDTHVARVACLDRGLAELRAQLALWGKGDRDVLDHAVTAAALLPAPELCAGESHAALATAPLVAKIAQLHALERSGKARDAVPMIAGVIADAEATKDHGALASALLAAGEVERDVDSLPAAREHLVRAAEEAGHAGADSLLAEALTYQAIVIGDQGRPLDALGVADAAKAIAARAGDHAEKIGMVHGEALRDAGRLPEAIAELEAVVKRLEDRRDPGARVLLAATLGGLASAYESARQPEKAIELHRRTLAIEEADYGPDHPEVGKTLHDLANAEERVGDVAGAKAHYERARAIFVAAFGPEHELVGETDISLAGLQLYQNHDDEAEKLFAQAQAELAKLPADHPVKFTIEEALGSIARDRDKCKDAIPHFERARAIGDHLGRTGPDVGGLLVNLGYCYSDVGRDADATTVLARAEQLYTDAKVPDHEYAELWIIEADLAEKAGNKPHAIELDSRMLAATSDDDPNPAMSQLRAYARDQLKAWRR
jgi:eukaryotic-like serine/threonine-protein kinase